MGATRFTHMGPIWSQSRAQPIWVIHVGPPWKQYKIVWFPVGPLTQFFPQSSFLGSVGGPLMIMGGPGPPAPFSANKQSLKLPNVKQKL